MCLKACPVSINIENGISARTTDEKTRNVYDYCGLIETEQRKQNIV